MPPRTRPDANAPGAGPGGADERLRAGLRDALRVAGAPVLERLRVLDLSLGTLGDDGAAALLASPLVAQLDKLDIHHHYCSDEMMARLQAIGIEVDVSEREQEEEWDGERHRYVAVSE